MHTQAPTRTPSSEIRSPKPGLLPRLAAGPVALRRSHRRMTRTSVLLLELLGRARRRYPEGPGLRDADGRASSLAWAAENLCALHGVRVSVHGRVPGRDAPAIVVANHVSYMDPVAIASMLPCAAVAKREIGDWPILGEALRTLGVLMVARENPYSGARVLRQTMRLLAAGVSVLAFPEGTTSTGDEVLPLRRGLFGVARRMGVPIVPVAIHYDCRAMAWVGDASFVPHYMRTTTRAKTRATLVFGDPVDPRMAATPEALSARVRDRMLELLDRAHCCSAGS